MARCPFAEWRGPIPNETPNGMGSPVVGVVFHIMGSTFSAADGWFHNPSAKASAHFGIKQDGSLVQWVDTADKAWHAVAANSHWIGVETEGTGGPLSEAGCQTFARLYAWLQSIYGFPFAITDDPVNGHGFGWHGMGGAAWGGHDYCPGPERRAQRAHILQLAQGQGPTPGPSVPQEDAMAAIRIPSPTSASKTDPTGTKNHKAGEYFEEGKLPLFGKGRGKVACDEYPTTADGAMCRIAVGSPGHWKVTETWVGAEAWAFTYDEGSGDHQVAVTVYGAGAGSVTAGAVQTG